MGCHCIALIGFLSILMCSGFTLPKEPQCGQLNRTQLYNEKLNVALDEHGWIGRLYINDIEEKEFKFVCAAIVLTERHAITAASCALQRKMLHEMYITFGNSNSTNAQKYMIESVAIHPNYNEHRKTHNIAIIQVDRDLELSDFKPICLPPPSMYTIDLTANYYPITGYLFSFDFDGIEETTKIKAVAHIMSAQQCNNTYPSTQEAKFKYIVLDASVICVSFVGEHKFLAGSALMGVNVVNTIPINFYLIGIESYGLYYGNMENDVFMRISSHLNWIESNIKLSFSKS